MVMQSLPMFQVLRFYGFLKSFPVLFLTDTSLVDTQCLCYIPNFFKEMVE